MKGRRRGGLYSDVESVRELNCASHVEGGS